MTDQLTAELFVARLAALHSDDKRTEYTASFKPGPGDEFLGVRMGQVFALAKEHLAMPLDEIEQLLDLPIHEARAGALSIMDKRARRASTTADNRAAMYDLYLRRHDRIDNWDLVDLAAPHVVGGYLYDKPRDMLYELAKSANPWERRTAITATWYFIRKGDLDDTFAIGELLVNDDHHFVQTAVGGWLREAGKRDRARLEAFLDRHAARMPRVALRFAIEHFEPDVRKAYLGAGKNSADQPTSDEMAPVTGEASA
jgi:3-methyladenine DNA glycosylase AlkD